MCQAGDFERRNGTGGESIYGGKFTDEVEGLKMKHEKPHMLSMANTGKKNTNGSQFFITTVPTPHLDGKHVVFGELESGSETLMKMSQVETDKRDAPIAMQRVVIEDCGELVEPAASSSKAKKKKKKGHKKARKEKKQQKHHDDDSENADSEGGGKRNKDKKKKSKAKRKEEARRSGKGGPTGSPDRCRENGDDNRKAATVSGHGQAAEGKTRVKGRGGRVYRTPSPERPRDYNNLRGPDVNHDGARRWDGNSYRGRGRDDRRYGGGDSRRSDRGYLDLADPRAHDRVRRGDGWRTQGRYSRSRSPHRGRSLDRNKVKRTPSRGVSSSPSVRGRKRSELESRGLRHSRSPKRRETTSTSTSTSRDSSVDSKRGRKRSDHESRGLRQSRSPKRRATTSTSTSSSRDSSGVDSKRRRKRSEPESRGQRRLRSPKRRATTSTSREGRERKRSEPESRGPRRSRSPKRRATTSTSTSSSRDSSGVDSEKGRKRSKQESRGLRRSRSPKRRATTSKRSEPESRGPRRSRSPKRRATSDSDSDI